MFMLKYFRGYLDPQKLIELKINYMNIFHMKISKITVQYNGYTLKPEHEVTSKLLEPQLHRLMTMLQKPFMNCSEPP